MKKSASIATKKIKNLVSIAKKIQSQLQNNEKYGNKRERKISNVKFGIYLVKSEMHLF